LAIEYWEGEKESEYYQTSQLFRDQVDLELAKAYDKAMRGYVYKPRPQKPH
jgi:hypothetical protein